MANLDTEVERKKDRRIGLARLLVPHWKGLSLGMTGVFGETLTDLLQPWPLKIVIDYVVGSKQMPPWLAHWFDSTVGTDKLVVVRVP